MLKVILIDNSITLITSVPDNWRGSCVKTYQKSTNQLKVWNLHFHFWMRVHYPECWTWHVISHLSNHQSLNIDFMSLYWVCVLGVCGISSILLQAVSFLFLLRLFFLFVLIFFFLFHKSVPYTSICLLHFVHSSLC